MDGAFRTGREHSLSVELCFTNAIHYPSALPGLFVHALEHDGHDGKEMDWEGEPETG